MAVICDHGDDEQVAALFAQVKAEQGHLDILVNNATALPDSITKTGPFWEKPLDQLALLDVGMRSHFVAAWYAAPLLLQSGSGLIVNTSSFGGRIIDALARDPQLMEKSGTVCIGAELGEAYDVRDLDGRQPPSHRAFFGDTTTFGDAVVE